MKTWHYITPQPAHEQNYQFAAAPFSKTLKKVFNIQHIHAQIYKCTTETKDGNTTITPHIEYDFQFKNDYLSTLFEQTHLHFPHSKQIQVDDFIGQFLSTNTDKNEFKIWGDVTQKAYAQIKNTILTKAPYALFQRINFTKGSNLHFRCEGIEPSRILVVAANTCRGADIETQNMTMMHLKR